MKNSILPVIISDSIKCGFSQGWTYSNVAGKIIGTIQSAIAQAA